MIEMAEEIVFLRRNKASSKRMRRQTRRRTAPFIFATVVTILVSQMVSNAFLNQRNIKYSSPSIFERSYSSSIGKSLWNYNANANANAYGLVHAKLALHASSTSTNKNRRKRKPKHLRNKKKSESSSLSDLSDRSISEEKLHSHLNSKINYGKNGPAGHQLRTRGIIKTNSADCDDTTDHVSDRQRDQQFFLRQLNNRPTLVLNANYAPLAYMPLSLWSWQDAIKAIFKGSVTVVEVYPDLTVRAANIKVPLPSVIALNDYVPHKLSKPSFTRRNVYLRDGYICQYCNKRFHTADLSLDHVVPRSMGGPMSWENIATCCLACNGKKGSTPLSEIGHKGMKLNRTPKCPSQRELAAVSGRMVPKRVHPTWKPYLGIKQRPANTANENKGDEEFIDDRYFEEEAE